MAVNFQRFVLIVFLAYAAITILFIAAMAPAVREAAKRDSMDREKVRARRLAEDKLTEKHDAADFVRKLPEDSGINDVAHAKQVRRIKHHVAKKRNMDALNQSNKVKSKWRRETWIIQTLKPHIEQANKLHIQHNKSLEQKTVLSVFDSKNNIHIPIKSKNLSDLDNNTKGKQDRIKHERPNVKDALSNKVHMHVSNQTLNNSYEAIHGEHASSRYGANVDNTSEYRGYEASQGALNFTYVVGDIYIYSAFYDNRRDRYIRIIAIATSIRNKIPAIFCHFRNTSSTFGEFYKTCEDHDKPYAAYVISCRVPNQVTTPQLVKYGITVSSVQVPTLSDTSRVNVKVISTFENNQQSKMFNVCVPPLFGNIDPHRLLEFIEFSKILGAEHFTFYNHNLTPDVQAVLDMYSRKREVTVLPWKLPVESKYIWNYGQSASVFDCLYRNMNNYKYITFNDIDEFIVPKTYTSWNTMIRVLDTVEHYNNRHTGSQVAAYRFQSVFFDNRADRDVPIFSDEVRQLVTLNTIWRTKTVSKIRTKLIVDPLKVLEVGIHHLSKPFRENYDAIDVPSTTAVIHHYRKCDSGYGTKCDAPIRDHTVWRYYSAIIQNVRLAKDSLTRHGHDLT